MSVPIIGQPKLGDWFFTITVLCTCEKVLLWAGKPAWSGGPGTIVGCSCGKLYTIMAMPERDEMNGGLQVKLAMREMQQQ